MWLGYVACDLCSEHSITELREKGREWFNLWFHTDMDSCGLSSIAFWLISRSSICWVSGSFFLRQQKTLFFLLHLLLQTLIRRRTHTHMFQCAHVSMCMCVCVRQWERKKRRERKTKMPLINNLLKVAEACAVSYKQAARQLSSSTGAAGFAPPGSHRNYVHEDHHNLVRKSLKTFHLPQKIFLQGFIFNH